MMRMTQSIVCHSNAFMSVSLNPKLVVISIGNKAKMLERIKQSKTYAVIFLAESQQEVSMQFAGQMKEEREFEFDHLNGLPVIKNALGNLTCNVVAEYEAGDHTLFVGKVTELRNEFFNKRAKIQAAEIKRNFRYGYQSTKSGLSNISGFANVGLFRGN